MSTARSNPNLERLVAASQRLRPLLKDIAFVGGCATGLLVSDSAAAPIRPTLDVDAIVEIASYAEFTRLESRLLKLGFRRNDASLICRWFADDLILDLMPTDPSILGFSNIWYGPALKSAETVRLGEHDIRVISAPYFLATKLEAFRGRGKNDYRMSHDLEDIITVIDGREELVQELQKSLPDLRKYLTSEFRSLMNTLEFRDALPGHLLPDAASQQRITIVVERIRQIIELS